MRPVDSGSSSTTYLPPPTETESADHPNVPATVKPAATAPAAADTAPPTPRQQTDTAVKNYESTIRNGENGVVVAEARAAVTTAVTAEIQSDIARRNMGVPSQYQTPAAQLVEQFGSAIRQRYEGDGTAQNAVTASIADAQLQAKADALIPSYSSNFTAAEKLHDMDIGLRGQPQDVVDRVVADPRVQRWIKDAASTIAAPYAGLSVKDAPGAERQATEAAGVLADAVDGLSPQLATRIVQQSLPTIRQIAQCEMIYGGQSAYQDVAKAVGSMGDGAQAKALTADIAGAYKEQVEKWEGFADQATTASVGQGTSPALAVAIATQLKADGKTDIATGLLNSAAKGVASLQGKVEQDLKDYADLTQELNWLVKNAGPNLSPDQLQKAVNDYIATKGPDFQGKLKDAEDRIVGDVKALKTDVALLDGLPDDLKAAAPAVEPIIGSVLENDKVQSAITFAASRDPGVFEGAEGGKFAEVAVEIGHKNKDLVAAVAKAYVSGNVIPALSGLNPSDPASVARANRVLDDFQSKASKLLGIPQNEVDDGVKDLRKIVQTLQTTKSVDEAVKNIHALDGLKQELGELKDSTFSSAPAGLAFRSIALGLSGAALLNSANRTIDDPNAQNVIGTLAFSVGLAQDSAGFGASIKLLDSEGALGKWGLAQGTVGAATEKFIGALNIAYFAAGAVQDGVAGNVPKTIFDVAGAGGAALATFGEAAGLGSWAGPVGVGVTVLATAGIALVEWKQKQNEHSEAAEKFFKGAGIDEGTAKTLSHDAAGETRQLQGDLGLSPAQVQELAEAHPEIFGAPGYAQSVIDVARANGISGGDVTAFLDAVVKDDPNYVQAFFNRKTEDDGMHPLSHDASLVTMIRDQFPDAAVFVAEHSPQLSGADAEARSRADQQFESTRSASSDPASIGNLLKNDGNPAYQAEIVKVMKDNGMLDNWVRQMSTSYHYNGWPEAARGAIEAAQSAGVLPADVAQTYLSQLG